MPHSHRALLLLTLSALIGVPALAQVDLSGVWGPTFHEDSAERGLGPELVDFAGLPINAAARQWALSWDPDRLGLPEHQCQVHTAAYIHRGPLRLRIWEERDPQTQDLIALHMYSSTYEQNRVIWMDGRPHPPEYAVHTWMGFSTGKWEGNILTVYTTHHQAGLDSPQRAAFQRPDHAGGSFHPARQPSDARERGHGSGVFNRAAGQERGLLAQR